LAGVVLDAGVLVSAELNEKRFWALWDELVEVPKLVPTPILAQVWRGQSSASLQRVLKACRIQDLDAWTAKRVGDALAHARATSAMYALILCSTPRGRCSHD
jgi:hypothetical protein